MASIQFAEPDVVPYAHRPISSRRHSIDLGLAVLETLPVPEGGWTLGCIAAVCGCSEQRISFLEKQALRKIETQMRKRQLTPGDVRRGVRVGGYVHSSS